MNEVIVLLIIGLVAGVMAGMFGLGGGAVIVPSLILLLQISQKEANGTSLFVLALPVGIFGCIEYYKKGKLKIKVAVAMGIGIAIGSWFGAQIALGLSDMALSVAYGAFLLYMGWRYVAPIQWYRQWRGETLPAVAEHTTTDLEAGRTLFLCAIIGFVAGISAGMFGIGGGTIIVTALMIFLEFDQKLANGTSLGALLLPTGLPAAIAYYQAGLVDLGAVLPIVITLAIGALVGARFTLGLPAQTVKRLFGLFLIAIAIRFLLFNP
jgi:uncharacterized membrane protein YfcA